MRIMIALEHQVIPVARHLAADGSYGLGIERLGGRFGAPLAFCRGRRQLRIVRHQSQRAPQLRVIDPRQQLQVHLVLGQIDVVDLRYVVLVDAPLYPDPLVGLEIDARRDAQHVRHLLDRDHFLPPIAQAQIGHVLDRRLHVDLLERLDVDVALQASRRYGRFDDQRLVCGDNDTDIARL